MSLSSGGFSSGKNVLCCGGFGEVTDRMFDLAEA